MKMLSLTVPIREEDLIRSQLRAEKGLSIFREKELDQPIVGLGRQITHIMFILHLYTPDSETYLRLKYPYDFKDLSV